MKVGEWDGEPWMEGWHFDVVREVPIDTGHVSRHPNAVTERTWEVSEGKNILEGTVSRKTFE